MWQIVLRADASNEIGTGHVQRDLALACALKARGWAPAFAVTADTLRAVPALVESGFDLLTVSGSPQEELAMMQRRWGKGADILLIDHYGRGSTFERQARGWARRIAAIDDMPARRHDVDLLIDPTAGRRASDYRGYVPATAQVLTGADYIVLRQAITSISKQMRTTRSKAANLFVCFGGSDPEDLTSRALEALADRRLVGIEATVVVGPANANAFRIAARSSERVRVAIDPPNLPALMMTSDFALAGSGTMAWELAYFGVPSILVVHSRGTVVEALTQAGAARSLGDVTAVTAATIASALTAIANDCETRITMSTAGQRLVDGRGTVRVADALERLMI